MKKILLSLCAMLLSGSLFANETALGAGQHYMGGYTSDNYSTSGLGLTSYPGDYTMIQLLDAADFGIYDGAKVEGMRAAFAQSFGKPTTLSLVGLVGNSFTTLCEATTKNNAVVGWNQVTFSSPVTLDFSQYEAYGLALTYTQTSSNYPISVMDEGTICDTYLYGTIQGSTGYYDIGLSDYGNLSIQAIVSNLNISENCVAPTAIEPVFVECNKSTNAEITIKNNGSNAVNSISYFLQNGGQIVEEEQITLNAPLQFLESTVINVPVDGIDTDGVIEAMIKIVKVNGLENTSANNTLTFDVTTMSKIFTKRFAVEEFTGTGCGYCPRGIVGMQLMREKYGDRFVGSALHWYNSTDPMYIAKANYASLSFSGAPSCMVNRISGEVDPYYGSGSNLRGIFDVCDKILKRVSPVGVEVTGEYADEKKKTVKATATIEALAEGDYKIEFVTLGDSVFINTSAGKQTNYYYQYTAAQAGEDMAPFCAGGKYGTSKFAWAFDDVALASSYTSSKNNVPLTHVTAGETTVEYTMTMPTKTTLLNGLKYHKIFVACFVIDQKSGEIVNCAKSGYLTVPVDTSIDAIEAEESIEETIYNLEGQEVAPAAKGLHIVGGKVRFTF